MQKTESLEKILILGRIEVRKRRDVSEMGGWHHQLNGLEFGKALRVGDRQRSLAGCSPWDRKESVMGLQRVRHDRATDLNSSE